MKLRAILWLCLMLASAQVLAQAYPAKPVRMVVPASPGGASDLRVTSDGIVGTQQVAESPADGHTLLVTFDTFAINPFVFKNLKWDPLRDFAPVMHFETGKLLAERRRKDVGMNTEVRDLSRKQESEE